MPCPSGFLCVDKPYGWTSFQVVNRLRYITGVKRVGHAGTLDPFATGVLVVAVGRDSTKQIDVIQSWPKTYWFTMLLGVQTDTLDTEGVVTKTHSIPPHIDNQLADAVVQLCGTHTQEAPVFCAKKQDGRPMYEMARQGLEVTPKTAMVTIHSLDVVSPPTDAPFPQVRLAMTCSKGTYVRSVARDLAHRCGTVGMVSQLIRMSVGSFKRAQSVDLASITADNWTHYLGQTGVV